MIQSMTGFGQSQTEVDGLSLSIEVSSVNRRNLEASLSLPREWQSLERQIQQAVKERFNRGKLHLQVQATTCIEAGGFNWDAAGLESSLKRLTAAARELDIEWKPDGDILLRLAALNKAETALPASETISEVLQEQVGLALDQLRAMRLAEGNALATDLETRVAGLEGLLGSIRSDSSGTVTRYREILLQRLRQADLDIDLDDERLLKEIAIFADKCDIAEELTRLDSHIAQFRECLVSGSPVGRKLEFILQEVTREFNTIGSKASNIEVSRHVIEAKNEIERIREQIQNIE